MYASAEAAERGFCRDCGTPLFFRFIGRDRISVSLGSLDDPDRVVPTRQFGIQSRLPFLGTLASLPGMRAEEYVRPEAAERLTSRQHPDRAD